MMIFPRDFRNTDFSFSSYNPDETCNFLTSACSRVANKHAPLTEKALRDNDVPFMSKDFRKFRRAIYTSSSLRNNISKSPTKTNESLYKKQIKHIRSLFLYCY